MKNVQDFDKGRLYYMMKNRCYLFLQTVMHFTIILDEL